MLTLHTHLDGYYQKKQKITGVGEDVKKLEPLCTAGGNVKQCSHVGNGMVIPQKIKHRITT